MALFVLMSGLYFLACILYSAQPMAHTPIRILWSGGNKERVNPSKFPERCHITVTKGLVLAPTDMSQ